MVVETHEYTASERQAEVFGLIADAPEGGLTIIGYGGAAGGAKTNTIANCALEIAMQAPGVHILVGRKDFVDLKETTLAEFDAAIPPGVEVRKYDSPPVYRDVRIEGPGHAFSRVWFKALKDEQGLGSTQYAWSFIDEGSEVELSIVRYIIGSRLRHPGAKKRGLVVGFNPYPGWCVDWFMRGNYPDLSNLTSMRIDFHFVRARVEDNPHLPVGYIEQMELLDPFQQAVLRDGDPDAALGGLLYFDRVILEAIGAVCPEPVDRIPTSVLPGLAPDGEVLIWERPMTGERYYGGADTADGKGEALIQQKEKGGSDRNSCAIYKFSDNSQVAAIYGRQEEPVFAKLLTEWGGRYNNALLAVERNRPAVLSSMRTAGYPNLYFTERVADTHVVTVLNPVRQLQYGVDVNVESRPVLLSQFREALQGRVMKPRDKRFVQEGMNFLAGIKPEAAVGQHDDTVWAHVHADQARRAMLRGRGTGQRSRMAVTPMRMT